MESYASTVTTAELIMKKCLVAFVNSGDSTFASIVISLDNHEDYIKGKMKTCQSELVSCSESIQFAYALWPLF